MAAYVDSARAVFRRVKLLGNQDTLFCAPLPEKEREKDGFLGPRGLCAPPGQCPVLPQMRDRGGHRFHLRRGGRACLSSAPSARWTTTSPTAMSPPPRAKPTGWALSSGTAISSLTARRAASIWGRPWRPEGKTAVLDCRLGAHIAPEGFVALERPHGYRSSAAFAEAGSTGPGAAPRPGVGPCPSGCGGSGAAGPRPLPLPPLNPKSPKEGGSKR